MNRSINANKNKILITRSRSLPITQHSNSGEEFDDFIYIESRHLASRLMNESFRDESIDDTDKPCLAKTSSESNDTRDSSNSRLASVSNYISTKSKKAEEIFENLSKFMNNLNNEKKLEGLELLSDLKGVINDQIQYSGDSGLPSDNIPCILPTYEQSISKATSSRNLSINNELNKFSLHTPKSFKLRNVSGQKLTPIEKGPMKAIHSVDKMVSKSVDKNTSDKKLTPNTSGQKTPLLSQKKNLTPTDQSRLTPIAQSTPNLPQRENRLVPKKQQPSTATPATASTSNKKTTLPKAKKLSYQGNTSAPSEDDSTHTSRKRVKSSSTSMGGASSSRRTIPFVSKPSSNLTGHYKKKRSLDSSTRRNVSSDNLLGNRPSTSGSKTNISSSKVSKNKK